MIKPIVFIALTLLLLTSACASNSACEQPKNAAMGASLQVLDEEIDGETCLGDTEDLMLIDTSNLTTMGIPTNTPFTPIPGNVIMLSHTITKTLIFTDCSIWKIMDPEGPLSEPVRGMDIIDNIEWVRENQHVLTTDKTLYFLDFDNGEAVVLLENVTSTYMTHVGTMYNPLRFARTADGAAWRINRSELVELTDDSEVMHYEVRESRVSDFVDLEQWFDHVRTESWFSVLTEDNVLWRFDVWAYDAAPVKVMENVKTLYGDFFITTDNVLWRHNWSTEEMEPHMVMENVISINRSLIITTDNELWGYRHWEIVEPFKIAENVQSVQGSFGFIAKDDTLWWLPNWGRGWQGYQEPVWIKENVLRTSWNWGESEYIITLDGSLWLFNYEENYLVQIFRGAS